MKFQDLVSLIGGFVKSITLIFGIVNFHFNYHETDQFIINYFFYKSEENFKEENNYKIFKNLLIQINQDSTPKLKQQLNFRNLKLKKKVLKTLKKVPDLI